MRTAFVRRAAEAPFPLYATVARRATPPLQTLADGHSPPPPKSVTPRLGPTTGAVDAKMSQNLTPHPNLRLNVHDGPLEDLDRVLDVVELLV